jgi:N-acetylglucosaminyl-diphospho-decaprenol L-rhamnosyltransferase
MTENEITIIINTFRSGVKLLKCLQSIESKYKVIIVENSSNHSFKKEIENKFSNVECIMTGENLGYAKGNNLGLSKIKSKYALILNPDCVLEKNAIKNFLNTTTKLDDFAIIGPTHENGLYNKTDKINSVTEVESVKGFAMFLNMSEFKEVGFFDSNFFIYLEEIDLCKRLRKTNKKIFSDSSIVVKHQGGSSHEEKYNYEMELSRNWHWMWSLFYFNRKHKGFIITLFLLSPYFISSFFKTVIYFILMNSTKKLIYKQRLSGLFNSMIGKKSWYRPLF